MKMRYMILLLLLAGLLGCAGFKHKDPKSEPAPVSKHTPSDDLPLLPRESAKEAWERGQRPLPPLPIKKKAAPAPQVAEETTPESSSAEVSTSVTTSPEITAPAIEPSLEASPITSPEVDISAIPSGSGETIPEVKGPEFSNEPATSVIPWGEEPGAAAATTTPKVSEASPEIPFIKISPENLPEVLRVYRGHVLFVNCWGIDCGPCVEELPHLERIYQQFKDQGLKVLAINSDVQRRWPDVQKFIKEKGFTFDVALKAPGADTLFRKAIDPEYGADPFTVIYYRDGRKIYTIADALTLMEWKEITHAVLAGRPIPITREDVIRSYK